ncbi:hypothetical protein I4U23_011055 [Adineta vaga]|nr:hypothetical protein I4U23_011055 [Adineta vaga]
MVSILFVVHIVWERVLYLSNYIQQTIVSLNLFENPTPRIPINIHREQRLTWFFILLIAISSMAVGFYIFFVEQNQVVTIAHPSLATYQQLYNDHPNTLQCPCSQISIPHKAFLNVTFVVHQICSSDLISPIWLNYLASFDPTLVPAWTEQDFAFDFRTVGASYFQLLASFCSMVQINIADAQRIFTNTHFINDRVLAPPLFAKKTEAMIDSFINTTRNNFVRTFNWVSIAFIASQFFTGGNVNFDITTDEDGQVHAEFTVRSLLVEISDTSLFFSGPCACGQRYLECFVVPVLFTNASYLNQSGLYLFFQVINIGCTPLAGFISSKIAWWYNITYLRYIQETYSIVINSQSPPNIEALSASIPTNFEDVETISLIREMLLETTIKNNTRFDQFYSECAPLACSYTNVQRREIIVVLLLLIAICGGLYTGFQIIVPLFGKLLFCCIDWWKNRHIQHGECYNDFYQCCFESDINETEKCKDE